MTRLLRTAKKYTVGMLCLLSFLFALWSGANACAADGKLVVIGFSQVGAESDWRLANTKSIRSTFTESKGYKLIFRDAQQKQEKQIAAIREFVAQKVDYIILAPVTEEGWDDALKEAKNAGIPVIIVDRMIKTADSNLYTCWVGSDFSKEGGIAAAWMEKTFSPDEELVIVHLQGTIGSTAQRGRTEGLQSVINKHFGWRVVIRDSGEFTQAKGKEIMERFLRQHSRIDLLYCENDNMAFGAMRAMDEAHRSYGLKGEIKIISFDATRKGLEATLQGRINYNVECNPLHGPRLEELIQQLKQAYVPGKMVYVNEVAFDAATITQKDVDARSY
jgi:simple sugar transport system substrate-binding protein